MTMTTFGPPVYAVANARSFMSVDVQELAAKAGLTHAERATLSTNGLRRIPIATASLTDLLIEVLDDLRRSGWQPETCGSVVFTHSLELTGDEVKAIDTCLRSALPRLKRHPAILSGRPCSVIHLGIQIAASHYRTDPESTALVLGADIAPSPDDRFFFGSAMGDSAVGLVLGGVPRIGHLLAVHSTYRVIACDGAASPAEDIQRFRDQNPSAIRATVAGALDRAGRSWSDLTVIVPHTPYSAIWDTVSALCKFPRLAILDGDLGKTGHMNSNDVLVHFRSALNDNRIRPGDVVALVSPGFGGTRGCTIIQCGDPMTNAGPPA